LNAKIGAKRQEILAVLGTQNQFGNGFLEKKQITSYKAGIQDPSIMDISQMSLQLTQLNEKVQETRASLDSSNSLSQIINAGVQSLETRKKRAKETLNMFDDIVQLRACVSRI